MDQGPKTLVHFTHCLELRPGIPRFCKRQGADPDAGGGEDRIDDRRRRRWKRRLAETSWRVVGFEELHLNRPRRHLPHSSRLILVEVRLYDSAILDGDFPGHQMAHAFDETSLN